MTGISISFYWKSSFRFGVFNPVLTFCRRGMIVPFYFNLLLRFLNKYIFFIKTDILQLITYYKIRRLIFIDGLTKKNPQNIHWTSIYFLFKKFNAKII